MCGYVCVRARSTDSPKSNSHLKLLGARRVTRSELYTAKFTQNRPRRPRGGEQRNISTPYSTSALDGSGWLAPRPRRFNHGETDPIPFVQETGWAPGAVCTGAEDLVPYRDSIPRPSGQLRVATQTTLSRPTSYVLTKIFGATVPNLIVWDLCTLYKCTEIQINL